jgi:hypothetical protein
MKTGYTRCPLKQILYNGNVKRVLTSLLIDTLMATKRSNLQLAHITTPAFKAPRPNPTSLNDLGHQPQADRNVVAK